MAQKNQPGTVPVSLYLGHLNRVSKRDAITHIHGLIRRHALAPGSVGWQIVKTKTGFAYEIQEGGRGRSFLKALLVQFKKTPDAIVHLQTSQRVVRVTYEADGIASVMLPEDASEAITVLKPTGKLRAFSPSRTGLLITTTLFFITGATAFLGAVTLSEQTNNRWFTGASQDTLTVEALPSSHWPDLARPGEYVSRVQYVAGDWHVATKPVETNAPDNDRELPDIATRPVPPEAP